MHISEVMPNGNVRVIVPIEFRRTIQGRIITFAENVKTVQGHLPMLIAIANGAPLQMNSWRIWDMKIS